MNVKILDHTQNPIETIYKAYRICYSKDAPTDIKLLTKDEMIKFIKNHINHESPLEHCNITFAIEGVSRALSHQLVRHRLASYSQQSQRYVNGENFDFIIPDSIINTTNPLMLDIYEKALEVVKKGYTALVSNGVPKEDARYLLPNATTTNLICTMNLREFRHFIDERCCKHAQWEIREMAFAMLKELKPLIPFADYKARKCGISCFECMEGKLDV